MAFLCFNADAELKQDVADALNGQALGGVEDEMYTGGVIDLLSIPTADPSAAGPADPPIIPRPLHTARRALVVAALAAARGAGAAAAGGAAAVGGAVDGGSGAAAAGGGGGGGGAAAVGGGGGAVDGGGGGAVDSCGGAAAAGGGGGGNVNYGDYHDGYYDFM